MRKKHSPYSALHRLSGERGTFRSRYRWRCCSQSKVCSGWYNLEILGRAGVRHPSLQRLALHLESKRYVSGVIASKGLSQKRQISPSHPRHPTRMERGVCGGGGSDQPCGLTSSFLLTGFLAKLFSYPQSRRYMWLQSEVCDVKACSGLYGYQQLSSQKSVRHPWCHLRER